jgi:hypothetical protein
VHDFHSINRRGDEQRQACAARWWWRSTIERIPASGTIEMSKLRGPLIGG